MPIYVVPKVLRDRLGEEASEALVEFLKTVSEQNRVDLLVLAEERLERRLVETGSHIRDELAKTWAELRNEIANVRAELRTEIGNLRAELRTEIANTRADLIKWMFVFWVGQVAVIVGILFAWFGR